MKFTHIAALLMITTSLALAQTAAPTAPPSSSPVPAQKADVAAAKVHSRPEITNRFHDMHEKFVARAKQGNVDLLFLGDSITEGWALRGKKIWAERYEKLNAANFGISGDKTQHVLWRVENGELENIKPKVAVLMIGTNNVGGSAASSNPAEEIANGVKKIVETVREKTGAKVLLLAVFPRGENPEKAKEPREMVAKINEIISKLDDGKNVRYLDLTDKFLEPDKSLSKDVMPDSLHPNEKGYQIWADGMQPLLDEMMKS